MKISSSFVASEIVSRAVRGGLSSPSMATSVRRLSMTLSLCGALCGVVVLTSCAQRAPRAALKEALADVDPRFKAVSPETLSESDAGEAASSARRPSVSEFEGRLDEYVDYAVARSPRLQARYAAWRAAVMRVDFADAIPEPTLSYGLFLRRVETRVGAQRQRVGLRVALPWPDSLKARTDAAVAEARAAELRFDAEVLSLSRRVADAYWRVWSIDRRREVLTDQIALVTQLAATVRARVTLGRASVAEASQVALMLSRLSDEQAGLDARRVEASAELMAAIGARPGEQAVMISAPVAVSSPTEPAQRLRAAARRHPTGLSLALQAEARRAAARDVETQHRPDLSLGLDYIDTARIDGVNVEDNGKDPIMLSLGVTLPVWGDDTRARAAMEGAEADALEHQGVAVADALEAEVVRALTRIADSRRRLALLRSTLLPQAETAFRALTGAYEAQGGPIGAVLNAAREVNALRVAVIDAQVRHARAWALLHSAVGRPVAMEDAP